MERGCIFSMICWENPVEVEGMGFYFKVKSGKKG
jgi:hypothetical protein